jgi:hypothetical protein
MTALRRARFLLPDRVDLVWMLGFLGARALPSCEAVVEGTYRRSLRIGDKIGLIAMKPADPDAIVVEHTSNFSQEEVGRGRPGTCACGGSVIAMCFSRRISAL